MDIIGKQKVLKQINRKAILNILRDSGEVSVADLSKKAKLSKTTLMKIINYYIGEELVVNVGKGQSTEEGGKKPNIFKFNENGRYAIGMIISANRLHSAITNLKSEIVDEISFSLETNEKFDSVLNKIIMSYNYLINNKRIDKAKVVGLAVGAYGITNMDDGVVIFSPHFPSWGENVRLKERIIAELPDKEVIVIVDNHSRFQVFAEKVLGLGQGRSSVVAIQAGKGMVAGVLMEGEIKRGTHYLVGEIGHMIIDPEGREICVCGGKGCFEAMVSTNRIVRLAREEYGNYPDSLIFDNKNLDDINIEDVFKAANRGDVLATKILDDIINWFAIGISNIILAFDPEIVIIQGIYTQAGDYFLKNLQEKVNEVSLFVIKRKTEIRYSTLGDKVGILGAASYVISQYFE